MKTAVHSLFCRLVIGLAWIAGAAVIVMMLVTCLDVLCRLFSRPLTGAFDIVRMAGAVSAACAIPYTTAIKGHVAIEYFFHKLGRKGRLFMDAVIRIMAMLLFAAISVQSIIYGMGLHNTGQVSATLQWPLFWIPYVIAFCCAVTVGVIFYNLLHPGKEMIKP